MVSAAGSLIYFSATKWKVFSIRNVFEAGIVDEIAIRKQNLETRSQILHALAASCMQSCQVFASRQRKQFFELKNEAAI